MAGVPPTADNRVGSAISLGNSSSDVLFCIRTPLAALVGMMGQRRQPHASDSWAYRGILLRARVLECRRCGRQLALPQPHQTDAASGRSPAETTARPVRLRTKPCSVARRLVYDVVERPTLSGCCRTDEQASWPGPRWSDSARVLHRRPTGAPQRGAATRIALRIACARWLPRLSRTTISPGRSSGTTNCLT